MPERFDVVILGAGPAGEVAVNTLLKAGKRVALVEREVIGGECTNWGCIPSKTLLRPPELARQAMRAAGVGDAADARLPSARRVPRLHGLEPRRHERSPRYQERGVTVVKATGRLAGPGRVDVDGRRSRRTRSSSRPAPRR